MIKYIKMMAFSVFLSVSAYGHNIAGNNDTEIHMTKYDGIYTLQTYPSYNCRKFYADWYQIRQHIMSSQAIPIPFRSRENKCDKVLRNFYIGGNKAVKFCVGIFPLKLLLGYHKLR